MKKRLVAVLLLSIMLLSNGCKGVDGTKPKWWVDPNEMIEDVQKETQGSTTDHVEVDFEKTTVIESDIARITAVDLSFSGSTLCLDMLYENYSDSTLYYATEILSANGYTVNESDKSWTGIAVNANDKKESRIEVSGISSVSEIAIECVIQDADRDLDMEILYSQRQTFYFPGETEKRGLVERIRSGGYDFSAIGDFYNQNGLKLNAVALAFEDTLYLEIENISESDISCSIDTICVNGLFLYYNRGDYEVIRANTKYDYKIEIEELPWLKEHFGMTGIGNISFTLNNEYEEEVITIDISEQDNYYDMDGLRLLETDGIRIDYREIYKEENQLMRSDYSLYTETIYKMLFYVENFSAHDAYIELDDDSFFLNYNKVHFTTKQDYIKIPAGYCGYIIKEIDYDSLRESVGDISNITDIEIQFMIGEYHSDLEKIRVSFTV